MSSNRHEIALLERALDQTATIIAAITPDQGGLPTRALTGLCESWFGRNPDWSP